MWLDLIDPTDADQTILEQDLKLSALAIEDATVHRERPKIEAYHDYWFVYLLATTLHNAAITLHDVAVFAGEHFVVTIRRTSDYSLDDVRTRLMAHPDRCRQGVGFLLYTILDTVVDGYIPVAQSLLEHVDSLEDVLFQANADRPIPRYVLPEIFKQKKQAQQFRRAVIPMRDIMNQIIRDDMDLFPEPDMAYFRDVYDHTIRVIDELDAARDLVNSALEIQLSVTANRQNEVAKQLTVIATIFLPLSFLTGFFGQNFSWLVLHITGPGAFLFLGLGSELLAIVILIAFFRIRGWF